MKSDVSRWSDLFLRLQLFGVSYAPLFAIFALLAIPEWPEVIVWGCLSAIFFGDGYFIISGSGRRNARPVEATNVRDRSAAVSGYLATYLLPFITTGPSGIPQILALVAFFVVAAVVYVKSDLALVNPTLYLYRWRVAKITHGGAGVLLVCRNLPRDGEEVNVVRWLNVYIEKVPKTRQAG